MLTVNEFEDIIRRQESSVLDFKMYMYNFENDTDLRKTACFAKDILSFSNTIRNETSFIIIGVEDHKDGQKTLLGIDDNIDDAIQQDKIKDKVYPRPIFKYYILEYSGLKYGIIEIPVIKHQSPLLPTVKMKGLEVGKIYYRQGTANTEALGMEVISINNWLQSLPDFTHIESQNEKINHLIRLFTNTEIKLSSAIAELYSIGRLFNIDVVKQFCTHELQGLSENENIGDTELEYRIQKIFITNLQIEVNPYGTSTYSVIKNEFRKTDGIREYRLLFSQSITQLESLYKGFENKPDHTLAVITMSSKHLFGDGVKNGFPVYAYVFPDDFLSLFASIRQRAIDLLIKI